MNYNFILFVNEYYGNTDWINHINNINRFSNYNTIFFGKGLMPEKKFYPKIIYSKNNILCLMFFFFKKTSKFKNDKNIFIIRMFKFNFILVFFLKILNQIGFNNKIYLDVRTLYVEKDNKLYSFFFNFLIKISSYFYDNTFIINDLIAKKINLKKYVILPLGLDNKIYDIKEKKCMNSFKFIFVGKIRPEFNIFLEKFIDIVRFNNYNYKLDIYSYSLNNDILELVNSNIDIVNFKGHLNRVDFNNILKIYDIGISHLPFNNLFDLQPHTKLFEYIQNGLPFITKNTIGVLDQFNNKIPGWLYDNYDDLNSILYNVNFEYHYKRKIIESLSLKTWDEVFNDNLKYILE